jgi:hypothetical protein
MKTKTIPLRPEVDAALSLAARHAESARRLAAAGRASKAAKHLSKSEFHLKRAVALDGGPGKRSRSQRLPKVPDGGRRKPNR